MAIKHLIGPGIGFTPPGFIVTRGLGDFSGAAPAPAPVTGGWVEPQYAPGEKRRRGLEWDKRDPQRIRRELEKAYERATGEPLPADEAAAVAAAVAPFVETSHDTALPPRQAVDWARIARDVDAALALMETFERLIRQRQDDEIAALLLLT